MGPPGAVDREFIFFRYIDEEEKTRGEESLWKPPQSFPKLPRASTSPPKVTFKPLILLSNLKVDLSKTV